MARLEILVHQVCPDLQARSDFKVDRLHSTVQHSDELQDHRVLLVATVARARWAVVVSLEKVSTIVKTAIQLHRLDGEPGPPGQQGRPGNPGNDGKDGLPGLLALEHV